MAFGTTNFSEFPRSVLDCMADVGIVWDHTPRNGQRNLEDGCCGYIGTRQFVYEPITVRICTDSETLLGLDAVVVVECIVGELTNGDNVAGLMVGTNNEIRRFRTASSSSGRRQTHDFREVSQVPSRLRVIIPKDTPFVVRACEPPIGVLSRMD